MSYEFEFDSATKFKNEKYNFEYYELNNFKKSLNHSNNKEEEFLKGKYFVIGTDDFLWHFISEALTQYELMLTEIPDLKLLFVNMCHWIHDQGKQLMPDFIKEANRCDVDKKIPYFEDIAKIYLGDKFDTSYIYSYTNSNFVLEKAYLIFDLRHMIQKGIFLKKKVEIPYYLSQRTLISDGKKYTIYGHSPWSDLDNINAEWQKYGMQLIKKRFIKYLNINNSLPKKIYLERKDANIKWARGIPDPTAPDRVFKREPLLVDYFKNLGYEPITLSDYGYIDQLNFFYNADYMAGLCGTNLLGAFIADKNSTLIEMYVNKGYYFSYSYLTEIAPIDVINIDLRDDRYKSTLISKNTFEYLDKYKEAGFFG